MRWNAIQVQFVDPPCPAVEQGDEIVAEIVERLSHILAGQQNKLNQQWLNHDDITTEELWITLQNYRSFLNQLLKIYVSKEWAETSEISHNKTKYNQKCLYFAHREPVQAISLYHRKL